MSAIPRSLPPGAAPTAAWSCDWVRRRLFGGGWATGFNPHTPRDCARPSSRSRCLSSTAYRNNLLGVGRGRRVRRLAVPGRRAVPSLRRGGARESGGGGRGGRSLRDFGFYGRGQQQEIGGRLARAQRYADESDILGRRDAQRRERAGDSETYRQRRRGGADARERRDVAAAQPGGNGERAGRDRERVRGCSTFAQRRGGRVEVADDQIDGRDHAVIRDTLRAALDRFLNQGIDGQASRARGSAGPFDRGRNVRRNAPREPLRDTLLQAQKREWQSDERCDHNVNTLLRRPKPSSTAGAPGSGTQRTPSTTKAYWCWPAGNVSVAVHVPFGPVRTSGVARASH